MPTYDYECQACGHRFEQFQSIKDAPIRKCPRCGRLKVRRLIGPGAGVIFKGSGFYHTDYRSEAYRKAAEKDTPASTETSSGDKPSAKGADGAPRAKDAPSGGKSAD